MLLCFILVFSEIYTMQHLLLKNAHGGLAAKTLYPIFLCKCYSWLCDDVSGAILFAVFNDEKKKGI